MFKITVLSRISFFNNLNAISGAANKDNLQLLYDIVRVKFSQNFIYFAFTKETETTDINFTFPGKHLTYEKITNLKSAPLGETKKIICKQRKKCFILFANEFKKSEWESEAFFIWTKHGAS